MSKEYKLVRVEDETKTYHFFTKSPHSISTFQKIFNVFCGLTSNKTSVNFIRFLNNISSNKENPSNFTLNEGNKIKEQLKLTENESITI